MRYLVPLLLGLALLAFWEIWVSATNVPVFILPAPSAIGTALVDNFAALMAASWITVKVTLLAFFWAVVSAVGLAIIFTRARLIEMALYPYVITLQVTPV
ncbi:MAG: ABC transporter permease, partial [Parvibaculales bacterium]